ncbi:MAG TPA: hypothetical protein VN328_04395 [Thermodesulfovibrionales bacterium]|nr:hypothetical protein [Thermodesulfovibrionales bacterium]
MGRNKKVYLIIGIIFTVYQVIFWSTKGGIALGLVLGLLAVIIVGGGVAFITRAMYQDGAASNNYRETISCHLRYSEAFDLCTKSLDAARSHKVLYKDISNGKLAAKLGMTWVSTGETITFQLTRIDNENTSVEVTSSPLFPSPVYNFENTERVTSYLKQYAR